MIAALATATGKTLWRRTWSNAFMLGDAGFLSHDVYLIGDNAGALRAFRASNGKLLWSANTPGRSSVTSSLWVAGRYLYVGIGLPNHPSHPLASRRFGFRSERRPAGHAGWRPVRRRPDAGHGVAQLRMYTGKRRCWALDEVLSSIAVPLGSQTTADRRAQDLVDRSDTRDAGSHSLRGSPRPSLLAAIVAAFAALAVWRATLGISFADDAHYAALPLRLAQGALPFRDEMTTQALGFLIVVPFVKLWTAFLEPPGWCSRCGSSTWPWPRPSATSSIGL